MVPRWTGDAAKIQWSYYTAASVDGFTVDPVITGGARKVILSWRLRGSVVMTDRFKLSQRPLLFVTKVNGRVVRWPIVDWDIQGGRLIATLGPLEAENRQGDIVVCRDLFDPKRGR